MRLIDAHALIDEINDMWQNHKVYLNNEPVVHFGTVIDLIGAASVIEAKPVVHAHWISASWEEDEENGIENTYSDEFICSNCKEHFYFPDAIEEEDIEIYFCPYCGATMDEKENENEN